MRAFFALVGAVMGAGIAVMAGYVYKHTDSILGIPMFLLAIGLILFIGVLAGCDADELGSKR